MARYWTHSQSYTYKHNSPARKKAATGDLAAIFWSAAIPFGLLFWTAIFLAVRSLF